jgi:chromosome partitioning protein
MARGFGLAIANQKGGVTKTSTSVQLARAAANDGWRVLLIDLDSQANHWSIFNKEPRGFLFPFVQNRLAIESVVTPIRDNIDCLYSNKQTVALESFLNTLTAREMTFIPIFMPAFQIYDLVIFDTAPSISALHSCAINCARNVLIPVNMDFLAVEGAWASLKSLQLLNEYFHRDCRCLGFLPTMVDHRLSATKLILEYLRKQSGPMGIPVLHEIRTDQAVHRCFRQHQFLDEGEPKSKALEDYIVLWSEVKQSLLTSQPVVSEALEAQTA